MPLADCKRLTEFLVENGSESYSAEKGILYDKNMKRLLCCPAGKQGSIVIPDGVKLGNDENWTNPFRNCNGLTSIDIPAGCSENPRWMRDILRGCNNLVAINVDENNSSYYSSDGVLYSREELTLRGWKSWGNLLICCPKGKQGSIMIPKSIKGIGQPTDDLYSAMGGSGLEEIIVEEGNAKYSSLDGLLYNADGTQCLYCPKGKMGNLVLPDGVTDIGYAFENCHRLTSITIPKNLMSLEEYNAYGGNIFNGCSNLAEIKADEGNKVFHSQDGILYGGSRLICCPPGKQGSLTVPDGVETIGMGAFSGCNGLTDIILPQGTIKIGYQAFYGCSGLSSFILPQDVTEIGGEVFIGCSKLAEIDVDNANGKYCSIDGVLYQKDAVGRADILLCCPEGKTGRVVVPDSVRKIEYLAFARDSLVIIHCRGGSVAEEYAKETGIQFEIITKKTQAITADDHIKTMGDAAFPLGAVTDGDAPLSYGSSNASVATVSADGVVTIHGSGTAQITITASETELYEAAQKVITITVNPKPGNAQKPGAGSGTQNPQAKKKQTITASSLKKTYGSKPFALGAKADGGGALSYAVSDKSIASVDSRGRVKLKGCGVTKLTIRAAENASYEAAEKAVTLTVIPAKLKSVSAKSTKAGTITVRWKRDKSADGYLIQCSTDKKFQRGVKTATITKNKATSGKMPKLKAGRKYYVRACAYAQAGGKKLKGAYVKVKKAVKVKGR